MQVISNLKMAEESERLSQAAEQETGPERVIRKLRTYRQGKSAKTRKRKKRPRKPVPRGRRELVRRQKKARS